MTYDPNNPGAGASPDAQVVAEAIRTGWIGRGFKLGIGFFLAGLVIWMIPMILLVSCVGGIAALAGGAALSEIADGAHGWEFEHKSGVTETPAAPAAEDRTDAAAAASTAAADAASAPAATD